MDVSRVQRHQEIMASQSLDSMLVCTKPQNQQQQQQQQQQQEKKPRPTEEALKCPRCDSSNTKFCYYNNYSLTQPRYFCKSCRRYWTKGGTLRNVPVGGGCRKNKRCSRRSTPDHLQSSFITSPTSSTSQHHQLVSPFGSFEHCYSSGIASLGNNFDLFGGNANNNHQYYGGGYLGGGAEHYDLLQLHHHNENNNNVVSSSSGSLLTPTIKQELGGGDNNNNNNSHHNRALLSYIMGGGVNGGVGEIDAHRESWNAGVLGSSTTWHNLINSPLM